MVLRALSPGLRKEDAEDLTSGLGSQPSRSGLAASSALEMVEPPARFHAGGSQQLRPELSLQTRGALAHPRSRDSEWCPVVCCGGPAHQSPASHSRFKAESAFLFSHANPLSGAPWSGQALPEQRLKYKPVATLL